MTQETNNDYNFDDIDSLLDDEDFRRAIDALNDPTGNLIMDSFIMTSRNSLNTGFVEETNNNEQQSQTTIDASTIIRELTEIIIDHEHKQIQLSSSTLTETINPTPSTPSTIDLCTPPPVMIDLCTPEPPTIDLCSPNDSPSRLSQG